VRLRVFASTSFLLTAARRLPTPAKTHELQPSSVRFREFETVLLPTEMGRVAGAHLRRLCVTRTAAAVMQHTNRVGYMLRPLPAKSGRVQGRLLRPRQLSGSSLILEVLCQNSASCVIEPMNTKVGSVGTVARVMSPASDAGLQRCTAEHLRARCDGGRDTSDNVVAACWICNSRRHRRKVPLPPEEYRAFVRKRLARADPPIQASKRCPGSPDEMSAIGGTLKPN
jgi:hypothetical protein